MIQLYVSYRDSARLYRSVRPDQRDNSRVLKNITIHNRRPSSLTAQADATLINRYRTREGERGRASSRPVSVLFVPEESGRGGPTRQLALALSGAYATVLPTRRFARMTRRSARSTLVNIFALERRRTRTRAYTVRLKITKCRITAATNRTLARTHAHMRSREREHCAPA